MCVCVCVCVCACACVCVCVCNDEVIRFSEASMILTFSCYSIKFMLYSRACYFVARLLLQTFTGLEVKALISQGY
jgi:hypothetical protein